MSSGFSHHEPCPNCGSRDNLGRYKDGSAFCFGCKHREPRSGTPLNWKPPEGGEVVDKRYPDPPADMGHSFSAECVAWLQQYDISVVEAIQQGLYWSDEKQQLIFMLEDGCWQARNFISNRSKYFTSGLVNESIKLYRADGCRGSRTPDVDPGTDTGVVEGYGSTLAVVEDCVSAIKIARQHDAMPMLGSYIANDKLRRLARLYGSLIIWPDSDKYKEACDAAQRGKLLGLSTRVIHTEEDPKCYTNEQIKELLQ